MNKVKLALASATIVALSAAGCTTVVHTPAVQTRVVYRDMPPVRTEVIPPPPSVSHNWVPGHWVWRNGGWDWAGGHYVNFVVPAMPPVIEERITVAPSPAHVWVRGHWHWGGRGWVWAGGTWVL